jgi:hypothetical protein
MGIHALKWRVRGRKCRSAWRSRGKRVAVGSRPTVLHVPKQGWWPVARRVAASWRLSGLPWGLLCARVPARCSCPVLEAKRKEDGFRRRGSGSRASSPTVLHVRRRAGGQPAAPRVFLGFRGAFLALGCRAGVRVRRWRPSARKTVSVAEETADEQRPLEGVSRGRFPSDSGDGECASVAARDQTLHCAIADALR